MLAKRLIVNIFLVPIFASLIAWSGWLYALFIAVILGIAAWEYTCLFTSGGFRPAGAVIVAGVTLLTLGRAWQGFIFSDVLLAMCVIIAMAVHVVDYERGCQNAATNFGITLGGILYLGWLGPYLISLRHIPDGQWWLLLALPAIWIADAGAYIFGKRFGRHKMAPRVSPGKTWEGYFGGILSGCAGAVLLACLWNLAAPVVTPSKGLVIGLTLSVLAPLGDLGESMLKRQFGVKDSSNLLPGHGGMLDRIDTWIWAAVLGYYLVTWLWL